MLLLSWNVNFRPPVDRTAKIQSARPDIITLQGVRLDFADDWAAHLSDIGLGHHYWSGKDVPTASYQCLITSRWKITPDDIGWRRSAPYPELLEWATVSVPDEGGVDVFTAHIPNGSGNGWKKIDTSHVLSAELRRAINSPGILTGDFNEPKLFRESGRIVTFGEKTHDDGGTSRRPWRDLHGVETPTPVTHRTRANPRCFDHTFVSRHFNVLECDYYHEWREQGLSDHSVDNHFDPVPGYRQLRLATRHPPQPEPGNYAIGSKRLVRR